MQRYLFSFRDIDTGEFLVVMSMHEREFSEALVFQTTDVSFSMRFKWDSFFRTVVRVNEFFVYLLIG